MESSYLVMCSRYLPINKINNLEVNNENEYELTLERIFKPKIITRDLVLLPSNMAIEP